MIRRSFTPLPAEVARSAFGDCATFFFGWCLSTPRLMSSSPLLLKLWVLHAEVELPSASPDKRSKRGTLFSCGALGGEGRSTQGFAPPFQ